MLGQLLLLTHLFGALIVGLIMISSIIVLLRKSKGYYKKNAIFLALSTSLQLLSGSLLAFNNASSTSLLTFCTRIIMYMSIVLFIELLFYMRIKNDKQDMFPVKLVASSLSLAMLVVLFTAVQL